MIKANCSIYYELKDLVNKESINLASIIAKTRSCYQIITPKVILLIQNIRNPTNIDTYFEHFESVWKNVDLLQPQGQFLVRIYEAESVIHILPVVIQNSGPFILHLQTQNTESHANSKEQKTSCSAVR